MRYLGLTLPTPEENLALDEALLVAAEAGGGEVLRVWEWPRPAVVLGSGGKLTEEVDVSACRADGVPVLRRSSGGEPCCSGAAASSLPWSSTPGGRGSWER
jgi:lipoate-protein ligase A